MIKVYGVHGSPFVRKVLIGLDYKNIPNEIVRQMPFSGDEEYKAGLIARVKAVPQVTAVLQKEAISMGIG